MKTKILVIAVIYNGDKILLRKKPEGSGPYKELWYLFGATLEKNPELEIKDAVKKQTGVDIVFDRHLSWDTEVKVDHDGEEKFFIYLDCSCTYVSGDLIPGDGIERLEWVEISALKNYDLVPPSVKLFKKLGYQLT